MPLTKFNSFVANYWSAVECKKVHFCTPAANLTLAILKVLLEDGYVRSFKFKKNYLIEVVSANLNVITKYNWVVCYSTTKWHFYITFWELVLITKVGGYYLISTTWGILNDSKAWLYWMGGVLLFAII
jgi:ribosomal protein S8